MLRLGSQFDIANIITPAVSLRHNDVIAIEIFPTIYTRAGIRHVRNRMLVYFVSSCRIALEGINSFPGFTPLYAIIVPFVWLH